MTLPDAIAGYLLALRHEQRATQTTINTAAVRVATVSNCRQTLLQRHNLQ
jgi:hypothetical protein